MQKMKRGLYDRIINTKELSRTEIHFLFLLASSCNESGQVIGTYYKSIAKALNCDKSKFYQLRDDLTEKGFITWNKNYYTDIDIELLGNSFMVSSEGSVKAEYNDYVDLNINIFQDKDFFKCKAGAIRMAMEFIKRVAAKGAITESNSLVADRRSAEEKRKLWYLPYNEHKKMAALLGVRQNMIKRYLAELQPWISVAYRIENEGKQYDIVTVKKSTLERPKYEASQKGKRIKEKAYPERQWYMFYINSYCRRNKIQDDNISLSDTAELIKQYRDIASKRKLNIMNIICKAIRNTTSTVLNSISVHKALKNLIDYDYSNNSFALQ